MLTYPQGRLKEFPICVSTDSRDGKADIRRKVALHASIQTTPVLRVHALYRTPEVALERLDPLTLTQPLESDETEQKLRVGHGNQLNDEIRAFTLGNRMDENVFRGFEPIVVPADEIRRFRCIVTLKEMRRIL
jgi:hypothetical protein